MFFLYMHPFISSEKKGDFFFHYLFICMTLDMTVCRVFLALKADFTCFSLVNISRDKRGKRWMCFRLWVCELLGLLYSLLSQTRPDRCLYLVRSHSSQRKKALLVRLNNQKGASSNWSQTGVIIKARRIQMSYDWCEEFDINWKKS